MSPTRRPLRSRDARWGRALAAWLAARTVNPNAISVAGVAFAATAAGCLALGPAVPAPWRAGLSLTAAVAIQLRLLANLLDGLVAIEGGLGRPSGPFFNEFPDRLADVLILVGAGYGAGGGPALALGWTAAVAAVLTAYVRALGRAVGAGERFDGPMAKPHRMAVMTGACLAAAAEAAAGWPPRALAAGLALVAAGAAWTTARRARAVVRTLERREG
jgi:phosphatidylglycerophosphate synthase